MADRTTLCRDALILPLVGVLLAGCVAENRSTALDGTYQKLRGAYASDQAEVQQLDGKLTITFQDAVLYPEGGYRLSARSGAVLRKLVPVVSGLQRTKVVVGGYTDDVPIGPKLESEGLVSNLQLSSKRADGIVDFLRKQGVPQDLMSAEGFGEIDPVRSNFTPGGRAANRRIEVSLVGPGT